MEIVRTVVVTKDGVVGSWNVVAEIREEVAEVDILGADGAA